MIADMKAYKKSFKMSRDRGCYLIPLQRYRNFPTLVVVSSLSKKNICILGYSHHYNI